MCIAYPGRVIGVDPDGALVDCDGRRRRASLLLVPDVAVGEWVAVAAGTVIHRLDEPEALEIQTLLRRAEAPDGDVNCHTIQRGERHGSED